MLWLQYTRRGWRLYSNMLCSVICLQAVVYAEMRHRKDKMNKTEMHHIRELQDSLSKRRQSALAQDLGLLLYLLSQLAAALVIAFSADSRRMEYIILFAVMAASALLASYRFRYLSAGLTGLQILAFAVYTLFRALVQGEAIAATDYAWVFLPLLSLAGIQLFIGEMYRIERTNERLNEQMESVVLLDSLTGLYNLRALYIDLQRQMAYCARSHSPISLMVIRLRYADELHGLLSRQHFDQVVQRLAEILSEQVRLEDRCYAADLVNGEFAVLLTCNKEGTAFVRRRIETACSRPDAFAGIIDKSIRVDLRIACVEYDESISSAIEFKRKADSEMQYDV